MKTLLVSIYLFAKENFNPWLYLKVVLFTSLLIFIEYKYLIYEGLSDKLAFNNKTYLLNFIAFSIAYYGVILLIKTTKTRKPKLNLEFWLKSFIGILIASIYIGYFGQYAIDLNLSYPEKHFFYYTADNLAGIITCLIPLYLVYRMFDKNKDIPFYGFTFKNFNIKIALILTLIVVSISYFGSQMSSLSEYYPILSRTGYGAFAHEFDLPRWLTASIFEAAYMFDFMMIELFFRGFMIFGFIKLLGKDAILPIATFYAVIHFGKPLPETISSFFGGYILGIVAYSQKNIGIGIILHCTLAFAMEMFTISW